MVRQALSCVVNRVVFLWTSHRACLLPIHSLTSRISCRSGCTRQCAAQRQPARRPDYRWRRRGWDWQAWQTQHSWTAPSVGHIRHGQRPCLPGTAHWCGAAQGTLNCLAISTISVTPLSMACWARSSFSRSPLPHIYCVRS